METLKYINLAVSKDATRPNIGAVYRDKNHIVATDGHRLHYSNGLADTNPGWIDGVDRGQFPDWKQIIPEDFKSSFDLHVSKEDLAIMKKLSGLEKKPIYKLSVAGKFAQFDLCRSSLAMGTKISFDLAYSEKEGLEIEPIGLNLKYLVDALLVGSNRIKLGSPMGPILIEPRPNLSAIIMLARFEA